MSNTRRPRSPQLGQPQSSRTTQLAVVLTIAACVAAIIVVAFVVKRNGSSTTGASSGGSTTSSAPTGSSAPVTTSAPTTTTTTSTTSNIGCSAAPSLPKHPKQYKKAPPASLAGKATWDVTLKTNCGDIAMQLDGAKAPQTVASFIFLARHQFFDDVPCTRVTTQGIYVLQCGDPTGTGRGGPGYSFGIENAPKNGDYPTGTLAMARTSDPNSNGSQFFIVYRDTDLPDTHGYSVFGTITSGLSLVKEIAAQGVAGGGSDGAPAQPVSIESVTIAKAPKSAH